MNRGSCQRAKTSCAVGTESMAQDGLRQFHLAIPNKHKVKLLQSLTTLLLLASRFRISMS
jgi:hypothetical protein